MGRDASFFHYQERVLGWLGVWGLASVGAGLPLLLSRRALLRQVGLQALTWGAIDALLAWAGRRGARAKIASGAGDPVREARRFRLILLVNAGLDVGYVGGALALIRGARGRAERLGMGLGILPQGLFLLAYDSLLAWRAGRWIAPRGEARQ